MTSQDSIENVNPVATKPLNIAKLERNARRRWASANPAAARQKVTPGSYLEVAHLVQRTNWNALKLVHRKMIRDLMLDARKGVAGVMPCFAPGTSAKVMRAFEGVSSELGFFFTTSYWTSTSAGAHTRGTPMTIRWSIVPDGTALPSGAGEAATVSNLKARLNAIYGNETVWRALFRQIFARWSEVSGVDYIEELNDDGIAITNSSVGNGQAGVRGDVRIGGHAIDGNSNILAYNYYPNNGDMVIDTDDTFFNNTANNSLGFRNVLAHEHGHGMGFAHVCPVNQTKLMEPFVSFAFDGPQIDDIQNVQRGYGDPLEENDTQPGGTNLGTLGNGTTSQNTLSLDGSSDQDYFRFSVTESKLLTASLRPVGGSYLNGAQNSDSSCSAGTTFNAGAQRDLRLSVLDNAGTVIAQINATGAGSNEVLPSTRITSSAGPYAVVVSGDSADLIQLYNLDLTLATAPSGLSLTLGGTPTVDDSSGNGNNNGLPDPGETSLGLTIPLRNTGDVNATGVTATLVSLTSGVTVTQSNASYPNIAIDSTGSNTTKPTISVSSGFTCGTTIQLRLDVQTAQGNSSVNLSLATGTIVPTTYSYTGAAVAIPDGAGENVAGTTAVVNLPVSSTSSIADLDVTLTSLTHTYVGDLVITLTSPAGTTVTLINRIGSGGTSGPNFTNTVLDDEASTDIQTVTSASAPFTGSFRPANVLSAFDGQNPNGTWVLKITDWYNGDSGTLNGFALRISSLQCSAPTSNSNQAPVNLFNGSSTFPAIAQTTNEDTELLFNATNSNRITISDPDAGTDAVSTTLTISNGTLTLAGISGLTFSNGDGTADTTMAFSGTITAINTALNGLRFTPNTNVNGNATLTVTTNDLGHNGSGGAASDTDNLPITINSINDAPTLDAISNPSAILEDAATQTVNLSGISAGGGETQNLTVTAASNNPGLIPNPTVTYTSPNATGSLSYAPVANQSGSAVITVTVTDNGGTISGGINVTTRSFTVNVTAVNDAPTLNAISNLVTILEDAGTQNISLSGIGAGGGETQTLTVTATSNNPSLIPNPTVTYTSANATGSLSYAPVANQSGSATITVTVTDNGDTSNGGVNSATRTFVVAVTPVNDAPTLAAISNPTAIFEDAGTQTINLSGISAGGGESQNLTVTATSNNPTLIPTPTVSYTSANSSGSISYAPLPGQFGTAMITVTVTDDGGTDNGGVNVITRTFTVTVTGVNDAPTLDTISDPTAVLEDSGAQTVSLAGISAGGGETQTLTVTATSNNPGLIPNPTVTYTSPNATGSLSYTPVTNQSGTAIITVTVKDNGGGANGGVDTTTRTFSVSVTPVNDAPTLNAISNPPTLADGAGLQTVNLSGISAGGGESQTLTVTATSNNPGVVPDPTITYTSPNATGSLAFTPVVGQQGTAVITVTVTDNGGTADGGINTTTRTFTVTVANVNDAPTLDAIPNPTAILEESGAQTVNLTGISAGAGETQNLTVTASSSNPSLVPDPTVTYSSPNATGSLTYTPVPNQSGTAVITVKVQDDGGTASGGVDTFTRTFTVTVTEVNDGPVFTKGANQVVAEDSGTKSVNWATGISAGEAGQTISFLVTNDNNALFSAQPAIAANGVLTFTPALNANGSAVVTVRAKDNGGTANGGVDTSAAQTFTITVTPVNDAPVAQNQNIGTAEETPVNLVLTASDVDNASLAYSVVNPPAHGTLSGTAPNLIYTPATDYNGADAFTFAATDGALNSNVATISITIGGINDAPVAMSDSGTTAEDTPLDINVVSNDTDVDGNTLQVARVAVTEQAHGAVTVGSGGILRYTPDANFNGTAAFAYTVSDGALESSTTVTITVTAVNDTPVAVADIYTVAGTSLTIAAPGVLGNDSDVDGNPLQAVVAAQPSHGTLNLAADGSFTYTPTTGYSGTDMFAYAVTDGAASATGVVTLTVQGTTPPPPTDTTAPTLNFTSPANGARVVRFPSITGTARDNIGVQKVLLTLRRSSDGKYWNGRIWTTQTLLTATLTGPATQRTFSMKEAAPSGTNLMTGVYLLSATAFDGANNRAGSTVSFRILDLTAPVVTITTPRAGTSTAALSEIRGTLTDESLGSGPSLVWLFIRRSSDAKYWTGTGWATALATLRTTLTGTGSNVSWARTTQLPPGPARGSDIYYITAAGYDRSGNRSTKTIGIVALPGAGIRATGEATANSTVVLSYGIATASTQSIALKYTGALDVSTIDVSLYQVSVNGEAVTVEGTAYDASTSTLKLLLPEGAVQASDAIDVAWSGLHDLRGAAVQGHTTLIAR